MSMLMMMMMMMMLLLLLLLLLLMLMFETKENESSLTLTLREKRTQNNSCSFFKKLTRALRVVGVDDGGGGFDLGERVAKVRRRSLVACAVVKCYQTNTL